MRRILVFLVAGIVVALLGGAVYVRTAPVAVEDWHVDPVTAPKPDTDNAFRAVPEAMGSEGVDLRTAVYPVDAMELAGALDRVALSEPDTRRLAGTPEDLWVTYVQRSAVFGFPDFVSVRVFPEGDGMSGVAVFSRSRYGRSDLGVNGVRVERWLAALPDPVGPVQ